MVVLDLGRRLQGRCTTDPRLCIGWVSPELRSRWQVVKAWEAHCAAEHV